MEQTGTLLGDFVIEPYLFEGIDEEIEALSKEMPKHILFEKSNRMLLNRILAAPSECFLLSAVIDFIDKINRAKITDEKFTFALFEFWLNHFSNISEEENFDVRARITGKRLPRDAYQVFFPIGMDKTYPNSHFIASHLSPDVDTMIAAFWGWVDAFSAKVSSGIHYWNLPGGPPESPTTTLFKEMLGLAVFDVIPRTVSSLTLSAIDLVTHQDLSRRQGGINISHLDHGIHGRAVIMIDKNGHYVGDWRSSDVEMVRQVIILFKAILRWFEINLQTQIITLFSKINPTVDNIQECLSSIFEIEIGSCEIAEEFSPLQKEQLELFLQKVMNLKEGLHATFSLLNDKLKELDAPALKKLENDMILLRKSKLFNDEGGLRENRPEIFGYIKNLTHQLNDAIHQARNFAERLDISIEIKHKVLGVEPETIKMQTDVEVIRQKMQNHHYLTVTISEENGCQFPIGVVWARDLRQTILGTVSFRDFCNFDEVKMASYLSVISVIDHHKASLKTNSPPLALIGDAQACNVLVAEQEMKINDQYSLLGLTPDNLESNQEITESSSPRLMERLIHRQMALHYSPRCYIHPLREYMEYLCFLHAILDDTDLLTKVTARDVICTAELLNRLKSLQLQRDVEVVCLDDIPENEEFAKKAAKRILQNEDMYSIYKKSFDYREKEVQENLHLCVEDKPSNIFSDAKTQNQSCRVSQTKLFSNNIPYYLEHEELIQARWANAASNLYEAHQEIDLHLHMISTIASAEEVYRDDFKRDDHKDELWFWIPNTELGLNRLAAFLNNFRESPEMQHNELSLILLRKDVGDIFKRYFLPIKDVRYIERIEGEIRYPAAILCFAAGSLNSRKAMVSPYLPKAVS